MNNIADQLLQNLLNQAPQDSLCVLNENSQHINTQAFAGKTISNRFDIHLKHSNCLFNDFEFPDDNFTQVFFRIAKEKLVNLHIIEQAFSHIKQGQLYLIGHKQEGINSLVSFIKKNYQLPININKHKQYWQVEVTIEKTRVPNNKNEYHQLQLLKKDNLEYWSKPGCFGWQKIDQGSKLMMDYLEQHQLIEDSAKILDLGCGYGYLSIRAQQLGYKHIDATDNCAAAIQACQKNFKQYSINGDVFASDACKNNYKSYDVILCNPPFHQGFDHNKQLIEQFVNQTKLALTAEGKAFFIVNQFIGIEKVAKAHFKDAKVLTNSNGFKLLYLSD